MATPAKQTKMDPDAATGANSPVKSSDDGKDPEALIYPDFIYQFTHSVIMIRNLNPQKANPRALRSLCETYGKVMIVRLMPCRTVAIIEMPIKEEAEEAVENLNGMKLWNQIIVAYLNIATLQCCPLNQSQAGQSGEHATDNPASVGNANTTAIVDSKPSAAV